MRIRQCMLLGAMLLGITAAKRIRRNNDPQARSFTLHNLSKSQVEVYWLNLLTEERKHQFDLIPGQHDSMNSHTFHEFEIREIPNGKGKCNGKNGICRKRYFQITEEEDQIFTLMGDFQVEKTTSLTEARKQAKEAMKKCRNLSTTIMSVNVSPEDQLELLGACLQHSIQESIFEKQAEIDFETGIRKKMGSRLKHYACQDENFPTSEPLYSKEWNPNNPRLRFDDEPHTIHVLLQSETTMIALIDNMIQQSDCNSMQELAKANIDNSSWVPWEARKELATIDFLSRIYAYVNPAAKLMNLYARLPARGQDLFRIWHDSNETHAHGHDHEVPDTWPVSNTSVYASLLMFCEVPEESEGAIHFPESGTHVNPKLRQGLLITHTKPPDNFAYHDQLTNGHYDCPIKEGTRTIVEHQLIRLFPDTAKNH